MLLVSDRNIHHHQENICLSQLPRLMQVKMAYTVDSVWRNRSSFVNGRDAIREFLSDKWVREQDYRLIKEIWAHSDDRIAVRFCYEYHNAEGKWFRAYGEYIHTSGKAFLTR
jgi:nuclear transport factor 2 (NTF2) superfamily protein